MPELAREGRLDCVHEHLLFYSKPGGQRTFETYSRFTQEKRAPDGKRSLNYADREDVFIKHWTSTGKSAESKDLHGWCDVVEKLTLYCSTKDACIALMCSSEDHEHAAVDCVKRIPRSRRTVLDCHLLDNQC